MVTWLAGAAGIWGGKGQGKTFQCNLAFKKLGIGPIVMSAGELESGNAGEPAKLIRQRYREASDVIKKGKMCGPGRRAGCVLSPDAYSILTCGPGCMSAGVTMAYDFQLVS